MNFTSQFHETADDLVRSKDDAFSGVSNKKKRLDMVRKFSNGLATMTEEEAAKTGRKEITNHLTTYSKLQQTESMFLSMVSGTNALCEILVEMGDPEKDFIVGQQVSRTINRGAIHHKGRFLGMWRKVSGEIAIAGGTPVVQEPIYGWLPKVSLDMIFPKGMELDADKITFAFEPREFTLSDLKEMLAAIGEESEGHAFSKENIAALIASLEKQLRDHNKTGTNFSEDEKTQPSRSDEGLRTATLPAWNYFEVKYREDGTRYVSKTIFTDAMQFMAISEKGEDGEKLVKDGEQDMSAARIFVHIEEAYKDAFEWLHMVCVDAEIGGLKNIDTLRGVAELIFPSASEMEELFNLLLEGDKIRAKPKIRITSSAKTDDVAKWNIEEDTFMPEGLEEAEFKSNSQHLQGPYQMLDRNSSSITGAPVANTPQGGELRTQSIERQQSSGGVQVNRLAEAYNHLEAILETVVWRLLAGDIKPGTDGYLETMWVRAALTAKGIDFAKLAEREYGRFKHIRVRAKRTIGNGDREQQVETADWMMEHLQSVEPASRPVIMQRAFALRTGDPDLAELAVRVPEVILNQQRVIAENEFDTIIRRALIGISVSPQPDDIHHNHIQTHMVDAQALIGENDITPWGMREAIGFAAIIQHIGEHIQILIGNPATNFEGNQFLQAYQQLVSAAKPLLAEVHKADQSTANQLTPKEHADIEIQLAKLELEAQKLGLKQNDMSDIQRQRAQRDALGRRKQFVSEITDSQRMQLDKEKLQIAKDKPAPAGPAKKKPAKKKA